VQRRIDPGIDSEGAPLDNAKTVGVGCQGFGTTLLIGASILLADAKIAVLSAFKAMLQSGIVTSIFLPDAKIAVKMGENY
jgi:hypothetical protein